MTDRANRQLKDWYGVIQSRMKILIERQSDIYNNIR